IVQRVMLILRRAGEQWALCLRDRRPERIRCHAIPRRLTDICGRYTVRLQILLIFELAARAVLMVLLRGDADLIDPLGPRFPRLRLTMFVDRRGGALGHVLLEGRSEGAAIHALLEKIHRRTGARTAEDQMPKRIPKAR